MPVGRQPGLGPRSGTSEKKLRLHSWARLNRHDQVCWLARCPVEAGKSLTEQCRIFPAGANLRSRRQSRPPPACPAAKSAGIRPACAASGAVLACARCKPRASLYLGEHGNDLENPEDRRSAGGHGNQHVRLRSAQVIDGVLPGSRSLLRRAAAGVDRRGGNDPRAGVAVQKIHRTVACERQRSRSAPDLPTGTGLP